MKVTRTCAVCRKKKTLGVRKFAKVKNIVKHIPERMKYHLGDFKLDDYVCLQCAIHLKRLEE